MQAGDRCQQGRRLKRTPSAMMSALIHAFGVARLPPAYVMQRSSLVLSTEHGTHRFESVRPRPHREGGK